MAESNFHVGDLQGQITELSDHLAKFEDFDNYTLIGDYTSTTATNKTVINLSQFTFIAVLAIRYNNVRGFSYIPYKLLKAVGSGTLPDLNGAVATADMAYVKYVDDTTIQAWVDNNTLRVRIYGVK